MKKIIGIDFDGTLIEALSGDTFPKGIWDMKIKLYVFEAIKNYAPDDILIISNQGGIEKGFVDKEMFEYKFDYISSALEDYTNISVYNFYCDNNDKDNINRKPNTGMIDQYMDYIKFINDNVDEENKIIYDTIMMIGDASGKEGQFSDSDKKTAENFGRLSFSYYVNPFLDYINYQWYNYLFILIFLSLLSNIPRKMQLSYIQLLIFPQ